MKPTVPTREERIFALSDLEIRADDGQPPRIVGLAPRYNVWSDDLGGFIERFAPGAFSKTLSETPDVRALFNHDANFVIGRTKSGTLGLLDQKQGLRFEATPPETQWASDLLTSMRRGDIDQTSFAFRAVRDEWQDPEKEGQPYKRTVMEARLFDVSVVTFPAYPSATAQVRTALAGVGIDFDALSDFLVRASRGLPPSDEDRDLVIASVDILRAFVPAAPEPDEGHHPVEEPSVYAGRSPAHLRRLLALAEAQAA